MAQDATGTPTPKGIPKYNTAVDAPSGKGFNAAMDQIDIELTDAQWTSDTPAAQEVPVYNGSSWVYGPNTQTYVPTWTSSGTAPAIGNGSIAGRFIQLGKWVFVQFNLTFGSTSTFGTGEYIFSLPVTAAATSVGDIGAMRAADAGTAAYRGFAHIFSTTSFKVETAASPAVIWGQLVPFTWGNTDRIEGHLVYEAA